MKTRQNVARLTRMAEHPDTPEQACTAAAAELRTLQDVASPAAAKESGLAFTRVTEIHKAATDPALVGWKDVDPLLRESEHAIRKLVDLLRREHGWWDRYATRRTSVSTPMTPSGNSSRAHHRKSPFSRLRARCPWNYGRRLVMPTFEDPKVDADELGEAARGLAYATRSFETPVDTYEVLVPCTMLCQGCSSRCSNWRPGTRDTASSLPRTTGTGRLGRNTQSMHRAG